MDDEFFDDGIGPFFIIPPHPELDEEVLMSRLEEGSIDDEVKKEIIDHIVDHVRNVYEYLHENVPLEELKVMCDEAYEIYILAASCDIPDWVAASGASVLTMIDVFYTRQEQEYGGVAKRPFETFFYDIAPCGHEGCFASSYLGVVDEHISAINDVHVDTIEGTLDKDGRFWPDSVLN